MNKKKKIWHKPKVEELNLLVHTKNGKKESNKENKKHTVRS